MKDVIIKNQLTSSVIIVTILIGFSSIILLEPIESMETIPSISIFLDKESYTANIDPESDGIVEINGTVRLDNTWPAGYSEITVEIKASRMWKIETLPDIVFTEGNHKKNITIKVHVPRSIPNIAERVLTASGIWYTEGAEEFGSVNPDETKIIFDKFIKFELVGGEHQESLIAGEERSFVCSLMYRGIEHDMIQIEIWKQAKLMDKKILVEISQDKFHLGEDNERQITVIIKADIGVEPGTYKIPINAVFYNDELLSLEIVSLEILIEINIESGMDDTGDMKSESSSFYGSTFMLISLGLLIFHIYFRRRKE